MDAQSITHQGKGGCSKVLYPSSGSFLPLFLVLFASLFRSLFSGLFVLASRLSEYSLLPACGRNDYRVGNTTRKRKKEKEKEKERRQGREKPASLLLRPSHVMHQGEAAMETPGGLPSLGEILIAKESEAVYKVLTEGEEVFHVAAGKKKALVMQLDPNCLTLHLYKTKGGTAGIKGKPIISIDVSRIGEVRNGFLTKELLASHEKLDLHEENVFSIIVLDNASKPLVYDFYLENQLMREWWSHSLQTLVKAMNDWEGEAFVYQRIFLSHLREGKSTVSAKTIQSMLKSLNMPITKGDIKGLVRQHIYVSFIGKSLTQKLGQKI